MKTCTEVKEYPNYFEARGWTMSFSAGDIVNCVLKLKIPNCAPRESYTGTMRWYTPDGEIYGEWRVQDLKRNTIWSLYDWIDTGKDAATSMTGQWRVAFSLSGGPSKTVPFTVSGPSREGSSVPSVEEEAPSPIRPANQPPVASFTFSPTSPSVSEKAGESIQFDASGSKDPDGRIVLYEWDFDSDKTFEIGSANPIVKHEYYEPSQYKISLRVRDDDGATDEVTKTVVVREYQSPRAWFVFLPTEPSILDEVQFSDRSSDPDGKVEGWQWEFGDGKTSTKQDATHRYEEKGAFNVKLTVTDNDGLTDTVTRSLTVVNLVPEGVFAFSPKEPYASQPVVFDASGSKDPDGQIVLYEWDWNSDKMFEIRSVKPIVEHKYIHPGQYEVTLRVKDNDGFTNEVTETVIIGPRDLIRADFTFELVDLSIHKVRFDASSSIDTMGEIVRYEWDWDSDGTYDTAVEVPEIMQRFSEEGPYKVTLTIVDDKDNRASCTKEVAP